MTECPSLAIKQCMFKRENKMKSLRKCFLWKKDTEDGLFTCSIYCLLEKLTDRERIRSNPTRDRAAERKK